MKTQTQLEAGIIAGLQGALNEKIDAQTIYHLLIDKGICTREEIQAKKKYIEKQYQKEQNSILQQNAQIMENAKFEEEFTNLLNGEKCDKEYLSKTIAESLEEYMKQ